MGKVASQSIYQSLRATRRFEVHHVHRIHPDNIAAAAEDYRRRGLDPPNEQLGLRIYNRLILPAKPLKAITLVREPIGRNISAFFQNLRVYTGMRDAHRHMSVDALIEVFLDRYQHDASLQWFDVEVCRTLDIDVYSTPFPKQRGATVLASGNRELLIMRHNLPDDTKASLVAEFLGLRRFRISSANVSQDKSYGNAYREFVRRITLPPDYIDQMLGSKLASHFFSEDELMQVRNKWTRDQHA